MACGKYLSDAQLKGFERYKYSSIDTSYLSVYVMHPLWNWCVQFLPTWLAPNLITFVGFLLTVFNFLLISYFDPHFKAVTSIDNIQVPRWVWLVAAINVFLYYNLDGMDGKQARRTGTSGPLGELFDHGLDSYSAALIPIYMFSLFGTDDLSELRMFFIIWNIFLNFYLTHFEKYNTGVMFLPWGYDFTMWGVTFVLLLTSIVGPSIWRMHTFYDLSMAHIFEITLYISALITNHPIVIKNIYLSYKNETGKMRPFKEAIRPLFPFVALFLVSLIWCLYSPNNILSLEPRIMFILLGTLFSNIACRLIVSQMSDTRCEAFNMLMWPLIAIVLVCCFPWYKRAFKRNLAENIERYCLYGLTAFTTIAHLHYGHGVVRQMCQHFGIKCFQITKQVANEQELAADANV